MSSRILSLAFTLVALATPAVAQTALQQGFNSTSTQIFPPTDWANLPTGTGAAVWQEAQAATTSNLFSFTADAAVHVRSGVGTTYNSRLVGPSMNLSSYSAPQLCFDSEVVGTVRMLHHPSSVANGQSVVEVSTDGGATWTPRWQETAIVDGVAAGIIVDLTPFAGTADARLSFRYIGQNAHDWGVDNVVVHDGIGPAPLLSFVGTLAGGSPVTIVAYRLEPTSDVVFVFSGQGDGPYPTPIGMLSVSPPLFISPAMPVNPSGQFSFQSQVPPSLSGSTLYGHTLELQTSGIVIVSPAIAVTVQ